jgi:hypothetical protein
MRPARLISGAIIAIRVLRGGNLLLSLAFVAMLLISILFYAQLAEKISSTHPAMDTSLSITGLRLMVAVGLVWTLANEWLLRALLAITRSAEEGDPFVGMNVPRLRAIGWALLLMQLLDFASAQLMNGFEIGSDDHWTPAVSGWLAVVLAFLLAEVFAVGAAMREEQQGTV